MGMAHSIHYSSHSCSLGLWGCVWGELSWRKLQRKAGSNPPHLNSSRICFWCCRYFIVLCTRITDEFVLYSPIITKCRSNNNKICLKSLAYWCSLNTLSAIILFKKIYSQKCLEKNENIVLKNNNVFTSIQNYKYVYIFSSIKSRLETDW